MRFWTGDISDVNTTSHKKTVIICLYHACRWVINIILSKGQRGKFTNHLTICATSSNFNSLYKALALSDKSPDCFVSPQNCTVSVTVSLLLNLLYASLSPSINSWSSNIGTIKFSLDIKLYFVTKIVNLLHKLVSFWKRKELYHGINNKTEWKWKIFLTHIFILI